MKPLVILTHQGFGDQMICNGIIRQFAAQVSPRPVFIFVWREYYQSIRFLYSQNPQIHVLATQGDIHCVEARSLADRFEEAGGEVRRLGYLGGDKSFTHANFASEFYRQAGLPFESMWTEFLLPGFVCMPEVRMEEPFILVHEYGNFRLDRPRLQWGEKKMFFVDRRSDHALSNPDNLFETIAYLWRAQEVHCIWSWLVILIELACFNDPALTERLAGRLFLHRYARPNANFGFPMRLRWHILD